MCYLSLFDNGVSDVWFQQWCWLIVLPASGNNVIDCCCLDEMCALQITSQIRDGQTKEGHRIGGKLQNPGVWYPAGVHL